MKYFIILIHIIVLLLFARLIHLENDRLYLIVEILGLIAYIIKVTGENFIEILHLE